VTSNQPTDSRRHSTGRTLRISQRLKDTTATLIKRALDNNSYRLQNTLLSLHCICSFACTQLSKSWYGPRNYLCATSFEARSQTQKRHEAKSANERQKSPSMKACYSNIESVIFARFTTAHREVFTSTGFSRNSTDVTQLFQQKPSPLKLIALVGKLDQDSGARSLLLFE
jgi:hypothetical protein